MRTDTPARAPRILVVDDEGLVRALMRRMLTRLGYEVVLAENGPRAIEALGRSSVDMIISDIRMPGGGVPFVERIKARWPHMPILFMTGYLEDGVEEVLSGYGPVLAKPVSMQVLSAVCAAMVRPSMRATDPIIL